MAAIEKAHCVIPPRGPPVAGFRFIVFISTILNTARWRGRTLLCSGKMFLYWRLKIKLDQSYCVYSAGIEEHEHNQLWKNSFAVQKFFAAHWRAGEVV
jgi:hypothetical protein